MKIEVHLQGGIRKIIDITPGATVGGTIGRNIFNVDGTLFVPSAGGNGDPVSVTSWELILNIPPNVTALANTTTTGLYVVTGSGTSATRTITPVAGETTVANGDGVAGNPEIGLADVTPSAGGSIQRLGFDAKGRRSEADTATTDNLPEGVTNLYFTDARAQAAVVVPTIVDGDTTHAPSGDAVFDALAGKEPSIAPGTTGQFWRGDKSFLNYITGALGSGGAFAGDASLVGSTFGALWAQSEVSDTCRFINVRCANAGSGGQFIGARSGGTFASKTATPSTAPLFELYGSSYTGSAWVYPASLVYLTQEAHSPTARGTRAEISITTAGTTTLLLSQRWTHDRHWHPGADNVSNIGSGALRMATLFAGTGTINTSDEREKSNTREMTSQELACASDLAMLPRIYQWNEALAEKGDDARLHCSPTVQSVIACMQSHGLDPFRYSFVCYDKWDEQPEVWREWPAQEALVNSEGNVIQEAVEAGRELVHEFCPAGDRYSLRPSELQFFIARGQEERIRRLEALLNL